jgi:hypothetical protein
VYIAGTVSPGLALGLLVIDLNDIAALAREAVRKDRV